MTTDRSSNKTPSRAAVPESVDSFRNQFLVAVPGAFQKGDYFDGSVSLLIDHSPLGAFGLMINRPLSKPLSELLVDVPQDLYCPVFEGGPVEGDRLFFLHSGERQYPGTLKLSNDIHLTACDELIEDLIQGQPPSHINAYLGYAGWAAAQLERELFEGVLLDAELFDGKLSDGEQGESAWLLTPSSAHIVFTTPVAERRTQAAALLGIDLHLANWSAGHD
ncbi:MAG: putative transcriptional regulator [Candidatus Azotimanducaceae bacterium]|jgi:putative transcriptional regulator